MELQFNDVENSVCHSLNMYISYQPKVNRIEDRGSRYRRYIEFRGTFVKLSFSTSRYISLWLLGWQCWLLLTVVNGQKRRIFKWFWLSRILRLKNVKEIFGNCNEFVEILLKASLRIVQKQSALMLFLDFLFKTVSAFS